MGVDDPTAIRVRIRAKGYLKKLIPDEDRRIREGSTIADLISSYSLPYSEGLIFMIDGKRISSTTALKNEDTVTIISMAPGG